MTIEEALEQGARNRRSLVVWRTDTGEILRVTPTGISGSLSFTEALDAEQLSVPTVARVVHEKDFTRDFLEKQALDLKRISQRRCIFAEYYTLPTERLVNTLEEQGFPPPMDRFHGSGFIVRHLFHIRRDELVGDIRARLRVLAANGMLHQPPPGSDIRLEWREPDHTALPAAPARTLTHYVAVLDGDESKLRAMWFGTQPGLRTLGDRLTLMESFGCLRTGDREVIAELVRTLGEVGPFAFKHQAMLALGQIGAAAGLDAVMAIRAAIYDSSPKVTALRERVCDRISTPESDWESCNNCRHGFVLLTDREGPRETECPVCLSLGVTERGDVCSGARDLDTPGRCED